MLGLLEDGGDDQRRRRSALGEGERYRPSLFVTIVGSFGGGHGGEWTPFFRFHFSSHQFSIFSSRS
jgi:hypothetical protein